MDIFAQLGSLRDASPASGAAQALVAKLQAFITDHYYTCTKEILRSLGQMYIAGDSMTENIDRSNLMALCKECHARIHAERGDRWHNRENR